MVDVVSMSKGERGDTRRFALDLGACFRGAWAEVALASCAINVLALALPLVVLQVYDRVLPHAALDSLAVLGGFVVACLAADVVLRLCRSYVTGWAGARFEHEAMRAAFERLVAADPTKLRGDGTGTQFERFEAVAGLRDFFGGQAVLIAIDLPFAIVFVGLIAVIGGPLAFVPVTLALLFCFAAVILGARLRSALQERRAIDDRRFNFVIESLGGILTVKALGMEALMSRRYERLLESASAAGYRINMVSALSQSGGALFMQLTTVAVVAAGALLVLDGRLSVGGLAACTLLAGRALQPLLRALGLWAQFQSISLARGRLGALLGLEPEEVEGLPSLPPIDGSIELRGVRFTKPGGTEVLRGIDLAIAPGEAVAITGETGAGRSTLLALVQGSLVPTAGQVLIDGHDLARVNRAEARSRIAYLPPMATLFEGSIKDNLTLFRGGAMLDSALGVAGALGLHEIVARLPRGYETPVGGSNATLPGGVRQVIAIARALALKSRIVLYDEADSQLDRCGDARLKSVLADLKGRATLIIVSHRPSILALADRSLVLRDGILEPQGGRAITPVAAAS